MASRKKDAAKAVYVNDSRWWLADDGDAHNEVWGTLRSIQDEQSWRRIQAEHHHRLYADKPAINPSGALYARTDPTPGTRLSVNVVRNLVDAVVAKITKSRPKPTFLTDGGTFDLTRRARLLEKFCEGLFYEANIYNLSPLIFRDACIFGTGVAKVYADEHAKRIRVERILPGELVVDETDGRYGEPRSYFQVKFLDRAVLADSYPEHVEDIAKAQRIQEYDATSAASSGGRSDRVMVVEAWHLPSGPDAKDGRHVIAISSATLLDEEYTRDRAPFAVIRWSDPVEGWYGTGLAEQLTPIQTELNRIALRTQQAMHLMAVPRIFLERGSQVVKSHLSNEIGQIIEYTGSPPVTVVGQAMSGEVYGQFDRLYAKAYETSGISQLSAQSQIPSGLSGGSGRALTVYNDIESERFIVVGRAYERFFLDIAALAIDAARDIAASDEGFTVKYPGAKFLDRIDWADIDLAADEYTMQVFPTSALANTPAARMRQVEAWAQAGWISPQQAKRLLDFPDLDRENQLERASYDAAARHIDDILYGNRDDVVPEAFDDLALCAQMAQAAYLAARNDNAPEDRLEALRRFIDDSRLLMQRAADAAQAQAAAEQAAMAPGPEGMPPGGPEGVPPGLPPGEPPLPGVPPVAA